MNNTALLSHSDCPYFHDVVEANKTEVGQAGCGVTPNPISEGQSVVTTKQAFSFPPVLIARGVKTMPSPLARSK